MDQRILIDLECYRYLPGPRQAQPSTVLPKFPPPTPIPSHLPFHAPSFLMNLPTSYPSHPLTTCPLTYKGELIADDSGYELSCSGDKMSTHYLLAHSKI